MKKIISLLLIAVLLFSMLSLASCTKKDEVFIVGITNFEPMNFRDARGEWTGFDTDFAILVAEKLGLKLEFQEIEWRQKYMELESGAINAIWNGFTANSTDENTDGVRVPRNALVDFSYSYMLNQQCIVVRADNASEFESVESLLGKTVAAEGGSAGEATARELAIGEGGGGTVLDVPAQVDAFVEVKSGASDAAVVDILLAQSLVGTGDYADLMIADIELSYEIYAIGFKKGDSMRDKVNEAIIELNNEGKLAEIAKKYKLENVFIVDTNFKD